MYADSAKLSSGQQYAQAGNTAAEIQTASSAILSRLNSLRSQTTETCSSLSHAADKVVGATPTPIRESSNDQIKAGHPPACCFLDAVNQVISDLERAANETNEHVCRLHRAF